jgi:hypothetical protein
MEEREQEARGVVEQGPGAGIPRRPPGSAAALLAVSLLGRVGFRNSAIRS